MGSNSYQRVLGMAGSVFIFAMASVWAQSKAGESLVDGKTATATSAEVSAATDIAKLFPPVWKLGEDVEVVTSRGTVKGRLRALSSTQAKIGDRTVLIADCNESAKMRLFEDKRQAAIEQYMRKKKLEEARNKSATPDSGSADAGNVVTTTTGKKYDLNNIARVDPDAITFTTDAGLARVGFELLPQNVQKKYGYDPVKAKEFRNLRVANQRRTAPAQAVAEAGGGFGCFQDIVEQIPADLYPDKGVIGNIHIGAITSWANENVVGKYMRAEGKITGTSTENDIVTIGLDISPSVFRFGPHEMDVTRVRVLFPIGALKGQISTITKGERFECEGKIASLTLSREVVERDKKNKPMQSGREYLMSELHQDTIVNCLMVVANCNLPGQRAEAASQPGGTMNAAAATAKTLPTRGSEVPTLIGVFNAPAQVGTQRNGAPIYRDGSYEQREQQKTEQMRKDVEAMKKRQ